MARQSENNDKIETVMCTFLTSFLTICFALLEKQKGTQWVHVSTAVNKTGWTLVDGSRICQPDLVQPQMYCRESQVLYELFFIAFDWFQILPFIDYLFGMIIEVKVKTVVGD